MYSILVGQQEDVLSTIAQLRRLDPQTNFEQHEIAIRHMIRENTSKIRALQEDVERLE